MNLYSTLKGTKKWLKKFINGYRTTLSPSKNKDLSANKLTQYPIQWVEKQ